MIFDLSVDEDGYVEAVGGYGSHRLVVVGHGHIVAPKHQNFVVPESVIAPADVESLHVAMLDDRRCCSQLPDSTEYVHVALEDDPQFHAQSSPVDSVYLTVDVSGVAAVAATTTRRLPPWSKDELSRILTPAATTHGCAIGGVTYTVDGSDPEELLNEPLLTPEQRHELRQQFQAEPHDIQISVVATGPSTVGQLIAAGRDVAALLHAHGGGSIDVVSARHLVRSGHPHLLEGLPESDWLEVKSRAYGLKLAGPAGTRQKIELAQDVARFANGAVDAVLVVGIKEIKVSDTATLGPVRPIDLAELNADQYRAVLDERIIPPIDGLVVERVDLGDNRGLMMISVPLQPAEMKPYLVHGAIIGDKVEGDFFSIVRRRGEGSITTTAKQIHAYIVAGRAFLRSGDAPRVER
ncbi:AlbA family DNA-binding domain-containing protein [Lentzea californiensis]|uniref:AlbA family DNA-binding domain-containing protein n=1 Tax=Lentzea californiensis TaxID=438851 RepID=UPI002165351A|nr:hypothetical protein [Lentzea californiensis]MCR3752675.1 hypothetical protein [Lentzea californiensis]